MNLYNSTERLIFNPSMISSRWCRQLPCDTVAISNILSQPCRQDSHSSHAWLERQRKDVYCKMSRYDNYRARSAYKLIQIDDKYKFLKPGKVVIEAGAAPGSWTQVVTQRLKLTDKRDKLAQTGLCLAIDIAAIEPVEGAICLGNADFTSPFTQAKILTWLDGKQADCILSDMAPNASGFKFVMKPGAVFLAKIWDGNETEDLAKLLKQHFHTLHYVKPDASRGDSAERYIFCRGFNKGSGDG